MARSTLIVLKANQAGGPDRHEWTTEAADQIVALMNKQALRRKAVVVRVPIRAGGLLRLRPVGAVSQAHRIGVEVLADVIWKEDKEEAVRDSWKTRRLGVGPHCETIVEGKAIVGVVSVSELVLAPAPAFWGGRILSFES